VFHLPWNIPFGSFSLSIDGLSAWFLLPVLVVPAMASVYGVEYLTPAGGHMYRNPASCWFFFNLLVVSMALVVVARNGMLFLVAWETMSIASFFLVTFHHEDASVRKAGWTYLVAAHLGTAFLMAWFALLGSTAGSLDFDRLAAAGSAFPARGSLVFLLAIIGFGSKAGFVPLHVWLPEAHPAAPSHVSAVMSGVMIKTGIYGILRAMILTGKPDPLLGTVLVAAGVISGIVGVLLALSQHDLKRLLAYSSVENVGIVALGLGLGVLGVSYGAPLVGAFGFAGALLHVVNHAIFKGLLFLGAGSVQHATGTLEIDRLGGLLKRMPSTGACFVVGATAIVGLPPLNGFAGELLVFLAALNGVGQSADARLAVAAFAVVGSMAMIGGLAGICFTKAFGIIFLGEPRTGEAAAAREAPSAMRYPAWLLALACVVSGVGAPLVAAPLEVAVSALPGLPPATLHEAFSKAVAVQTGVSFVAATLIAAWAGIGLLRRRLLARREVRQGVTWDCGFAEPTARMQYTGSGFTQPVTTLFGDLLRTRTEFRKSGGLFPREASLESRTPDVFLEGLFGAVFRGFKRTLLKLRWLQHGRLHLYVLYIAITVFVLLVLELGFRR
jgi:formate hydrogenlyase subunit 3/multisubunit Na+/H+ antiporter MnhD subunit